MSTTQKFPLTETLARQLHTAEMGHTGQSWDALDSDFGQERYRKEAGRVLEGWWDQSKPIVVLDLDADEMWLEARP